jgi:hypothetical protein
MISAAFLWFDGILLHYKIVACDLAALCIFDECSKSALWPRVSLKNAVQQYCAIRHLLMV